jgi:hypothetical protein
LCQKTSPNVDLIETQKKKKKKKKKIQNFFNKKIFLD